MSLEKITSIAEFDQLLKAKERFMFLKNSTTCPISAEALRVFTKAADELHALWYYLHVQESRELSNYIADTFQIKHESPQAFLLENGKVTWHDSHWKITEEILKQKWTGERRP